MNEYEYEHSCVYGPFLILWHTCWKLW